MFPAFVENPTNLFFEGQDQDENILLLIRAHPITNLPWIILAIFVFLIPVIVPIVAPFVNVNLELVPDIYLIALTVINYLLVLIIVFEGFLSWYFNVNMVTSKRIYDIDFHAILLKNIDQAPLSSIEQADSSQGGVFGLIFNFGNVSVQTAGAHISITMKKVPNAAYIADFILDLAQEVHKNGK